MERAPTNVVPLPVRLLGRAVGSTDREFSPLDVTLLTTPPSPIHARLIQVICTLMFAILAALWFGRVDIYATGAARIQPPGRSKVLQPLDGGRVRAIHTANGAHVRKGDVLVELDPTETQADREINQRQLTALDAEIARREASIEVARQGHLRPLPVIAFDANVDAADQAREQDVFATDIADLAAKLDSSNAQIAEKQAQE